MVDILKLNGPHKNFENIKHLDENGVEFWYARELMEILGYLRWESFEMVINKAKKACVESGQFLENHFRDLTKMVKIGSNTVRPIKDWQLDRYACYLVAQNGDPAKTEIAQAQTYFAIQTRKQELSSNESYDQIRLDYRNKVKAQNKKLTGTAKLAGVLKFGVFNDSGYLGLYGMKLKEIEAYKKIKKGQLLDRSGAEELAANLFRITQTEAKIRRENIRGQNDANKTHYDVGSKVRSTIKDIGGVMPEELPMEKHIKVIKKGLKKLSK